MTRRSFLRGLAAIGAAVVASGGVAVVAADRGRLEASAVEAAVSRPLFLQGDVISIDGHDGLYVVTLDGGGAAIGPGGCLRIDDETVRVRRWPWGFDDGFEVQP